MTTQTVLEHKTRKIIHRYISTHPGVSFNTLTKIFDLNKSTLNYHLNYLEKAKKVFSEVKGRHKYYFSEQRTSSNLEHFIKFDINTLTSFQLRILNIIQKHPGITRERIMKKSKIKRQTLSYNLLKLEELKIIKKDQDNKKESYKYISTEERRFLIMKRLLLRLLQNEIDEEQFLAIKEKIDRLNINEED